MFFGKKKRAEFMTEMSKDENKNMMICLLTLLIGLIPCGDGWQFKICLCPIAYGILFVPLILVIYFGVNGPGILIIISSVGFIFYLIALLGIFGKLMCGCLTHPCNWFFVMVVSLLFSITSNVLCFIFKPREADNSDYTFFRVLMVGNIIVCLVFFVQTFKVYRKMRDIYLGTKCLDLLLIDLCVQIDLKNLSNEA